MLLPDGNGAPESRSAAALASGSVVVKPASASAGFYYSALRPAEHFLPVRADFADLEQTLEWARAHDAEAERIAARARRFARTHLREVPVACYVIALLEAYAALQRGLLSAAELPAEPIEADPAFARVAREVQRARARAPWARELRLHARKRRYANYYVRRRLSDETKYHGTHGNMPVGAREQFLQFLAMCEFAPPRGIGRQFGRFAGSGASGIAELLWRRLVRDQVR